VPEPGEFVGSESHIEVVVTFWLESDDGRFSLGAPGVAWVAASGTSSLSLSAPDAALDPSLGADPTTLRLELEVDGETASGTLTDEQGPIGSW